VNSDCDVVSVARRKRNERGRGKGTYFDGDVVSSLGRQGL
jgi:hypothetical protein